MAARTDDPKTYTGGGGLKMQHFLPHIFSETEADPQTKIFGHHW